MSKALSTLHSVYYPQLGMWLNVPNKTVDGQGSIKFHVSYNNYDVRTFGSDTTALVVKGWDFYVLNGDHRQGYAPLLHSLNECLDYFWAHADQINEKSVVGDTCLEPGQQRMEVNYE